MNSAERVRRRLGGEPVDRPPNWDILMTFAAHFIGAPLSRYYQDYHTLCAANMAVLEAFDLDIVQTISDPYRETADFGGEVVFPEDGLPVCGRPLLGDPVALARLRPPDPSTGRRMSDRLEAVRWLNAQVDGEVPVMGWVEGALAEAADLRGVGQLLTDMHDRPEWVCELLELCTQTAIAFARAQVALGADIVGLGDAIASQISAASYQRFALPYEQRLIAAVHAAGAKARLHICGNITHLLPLVAQAGADVMDIDWKVDLGAATRQFAGRLSTCGNFDPVAIMLRGTPDQVRGAVAACLRLGGRHGISAAGCEIPDGTPYASFRAQAAALQAHAGTDLERDPGSSNPVAEARRLEAIE